jgi:hypothetical protein
VVVFVVVVWVVVVVGGGGGVNMFQVLVVGESCACSDTLGCLARAS